MKTYRDFGIILKKNDIGEADTIVVLLTRGEGLVRCVAKGVRRLTSRKGGNVEMFNQIDALLSRGRSLDVLSEATAIDAFGLWRNDLERVSQAYYVADLTTMLLVEGEEYPYIYDQLSAFYAWLGHATYPSVLVRWYEVQLLSSLGFWAPGHIQSESQNAINVLQSFAIRSAGEACKLRVADALNSELERLMRGQLMDVLEREPKTEEFIYQVRALNDRLLVA